MANEALGWLSHHPYTALSGLLLACCAIGLLASRTQRKPAIIAGVYGAPYAIATLLFVPEYWRPVRIGGLPVGVEDLVFSFATGGLAWLLATHPFRRPVVTEVRPWRSFIRYGACSTAGLSIALGAWWSGMGIMPAFWLSMVVVGGCLLVWRPSMWRLSLTGAIWFVALYAAATVTVFSAFPRLGLHFTQTNLLGITVLGVPVEELVWALGYGAVYPLVLAYSFEAVVNPPPRRSTT